MEAQNGFMFKKKIILSIVNTTFENAKGGIAEHKQFVASTQKSQNKADWDVQTAPFTLEASV